MLEVRGLTVRFPGAPRPVVDGVDLEVERGMVLGIVGETGAGKTLTTRAVLRAIRDAEVSAERVDFEGIDLLNAPRAVLQRVRGKKIAVVVQDARSALNPMQTVGTSMRHVVRTHDGVGRREARARTLAMLESVGLADPENVIRRYPHELSGGMAQRVVIAAALVTNPDLVIADEATTGLDLTVQAQILDLLQAEIAKRNAAAIVVTHDLGIVAHYCTDVVVMYAGRVRERGPVRDVFAAPAHPYTATLLAATRRAAADRGPDAPPPDWDAACTYASRCPFTEEICVTGPLPLQRAGARSSLCRLPITEDAQRAPAQIPAASPAAGDGAAGDGGLVRAENLRKAFSRPGGERLYAVNGVDLEIRAGETLALVGESGAGKSTVGRCLLKLTDVDSGQILLEGVDITREPRRAFRHRRTHVQAVFQDPASSLDARMRAVDIVTEPLAIFRRELGREARRAEGLRLMASVGLGEELAERFPRQLSGGQQQRLAIARAISTQPRLIVLDEPTASLDMSVRGQVLGLLRDLQRDHGLSYLLISHDLQTVRSLSERIVVMYLGEIVETGPTDEVFRRPRHPYTKALLSATLIPDPTRPPAHVPLRGEIPKPTALPHGCFLAGRCPLAIAECRAEHPPLIPVGDAHTARCIRLDQT
jgi:oligopeptide/dipeptide ABC transporter ATP-binding protein